MGERERKKERKKEKARKRESERRERERERKRKRACTHARSCGQNLSSTCCGVQPMTVSPSIFRTESPTSICPHWNAGPPFASPACACANVHTHACMRACTRARAGVRAGATHRQRALASESKRITHPHRVRPRGPPPVHGTCHDKFLGRRVEGQHHPHSALARRLRRLPLRGNMLRVVP